MAKKPTLSDRIALLEQTQFTVGKRCREWFHFLQGPETVRLRENGVHLAGLSLLRPPYINSRPYSKFEALLFILEGRMRLTLPGAVTALQAGEVWAVPANSLCRYELPSGSARMGWVHLDPGSLPTTLAEAARICTDPLVVARMHLHLESLRQESSRTDPGSRQLCHKIYELLEVELWRLLRSQDNDRTAGNIHRVWEEVEKDPSHGWDIPTMAKRANLSPSRFSALCIQCFGLPPHEKLTRIRMDRSMGLLLSSDQKVEAIALQAGYASLAAFCKAFKKAHGISPTEFRENRGRV